MTDPRTRGLFLGWRDELAAKAPRSADLTLTVFARVLSWAKDRGMSPANPLEKPDRVWNGSRAEMVWTDQEEAAFMDVASEPLRLAFTLAVWTGQRQGDLLRLGWASYDGQAIQLQQSKTGARVRVPLPAQVRAALDAAPRVAPTILTNTRSKPWTSDGFRASWNRAAEEAGVTGKTFNDLRGTAVTRLAVAGCTHAEIGSITGHKAADVSAILDKHYLGTDPRLAQNAQRKREAYENRA